MKIAAIICEYNPFHNGHKYQIETTRKKLGVDYVIAIMSGNYVQRGEPAIFNKQLRTKAALSCGIDLVIELPLWFATSSANYFARGSVALLNALGIVDYLSFGSEGSDLTSLLLVRDFLTTHKDELTKAMLRFCKDGLSYPAAREAAILEYCPNKDYVDLLRKPNNILALEYLIALEDTHSSIQPFSVLRTDGGYHQEEVTGQFASATAIRKILNSNSSLSDVFSVIPESCHALLDTHSFAPMQLEDFKEIIYSKILQSSSLNDYFDVTEDLSNRIKKCFDPTLRIDDFIANCQNRSLTSSRISRSLLHIALGMKESSMMQLKKDDYSLYFQVLGFKTESSHLLRQIKEKKTWPMVQHCYDSLEELPASKKELLTIEKQANQLYSMLLGSKYGISFKDQQIIV